MPELPEVETVRAGLEPVVTGATITGVEVLEPRSLRRHGGDATDFERRLVGRRVRSAARRGKFLWLPLEPVVSEGGADAGGRAVEGPDAGGRDAVLAHLGMSGQLLLRDEGAPRDRLERIRLTLESPRLGEVAVAFVDQRIFGSLAVDPLEPTADGASGGLGDPEPLVPRQVAHIARDPLDPAFDDDRFRAALAARRTGVKRALLDQTLVSGVGNIYADEALWAARLHYDRPTDRLTRPQVVALLAELRAVLERALVDGGTSFDEQYKNVNGASGYFAQRLNAYGRQGASCARCGGAIVREAFMNRSSHFCPSCQRRARIRRSASGATARASR